MAISEPNDKQGWRACVSDNQKMLDKMNMKNKDSAIPYAVEFVKRVEDLVFYPIYTLEPGGNWSQERVSLLGDTAHGVGGTLSRE